MNTTYKIHDFLDCVKKYDEQTKTILSITDMTQILYHAIIMIPWVHITKEWEITVRGNTLTLTGILAPRILVNIITYNKHLRVILIENDEIDKNPKQIMDLTVSVQEVNIIGALSKILNNYQHQTSIGIRRHFLNYSSVKNDEKLYKNDLGIAYQFFNGNILWVSPTKETFYDTTESRWIHPKERDVITTAIKNNTIVWNSLVKSQPLPPEEAYE